MALTRGTWRSVTPRVGMQPIEDVSTTQKHPLGTKLMANDVGTTAYGEACFCYVKGVASGAQNEWVTYNKDDWSTTLLAADAIGPVGIMMSALDAATDFGWLMVSGKAIGSCLTQLADNAQVWITATGGSIDDASVAGDLVNNAKSASAAVVDDLHAEFEITFPWVDNISSAT